MNDEWYRLDNVGFYYASMKNKKNPTVNRFSITLTEKIDETILLDAAKETMKVFPNFHVTLKSGFFWYYLEESTLDVKVKEEHTPICYKLYHDSSDILYRITYYNNRINLEVSHIVSDGRGTIELFKYLISTYIIMKYKLHMMVQSNASYSDKMEDSFDKYYKHTNPPKGNYKNIYHYEGRRLNNTTRFIELHMPVNKVLAQAHKYNSSLTVYLVSVLIQSIIKEMKTSDKNKLIKIDLPVDLRSFFDSSSSKNFFGLVAIDYELTEDNSFEHIINVVKEQFNDKIKPEALEERMNKMAAFTKWIAARMIPLFIKNVGMYFIDKFTGNLHTTTLSNVGSISFPKEIEKYIKFVAVFTSTNYFQFIVSSNKNDLCLGISSKYKYNNIVRNFSDYLLSNGIEETMYTDVM